MVGTPGPFEYGPLQIEVVSNPWLPYVPALVGFIGSLLVAAVAFYGVHKSNRTTRDATDAADKRERDRWEKDRQRERENWHRDNLMRLCSDALRVAREVQQHYIDAAAACTIFSDLSEAKRSFREHMNAADAAIDKVVSLHYEIDLLGESKVAFELLEFREVAVFVSPPMREFHNYLMAHFDELNNLNYLNSLEWRRYLKATVHINHAISDFKSIAQSQISPDAKPSSSILPELWPTPDKEPELFYREAGRRNSPFRRPSPYDWNAGDTADPPSPGEADTAGSG